MNKIDSTVIKETKYIAAWVIIFSVVMEAVFLIIGKWDYTVLLGNLLGGFCAVANFFAMGITVQKAVEKDEKEAKSAIKASQALRTVVLFAIIALGAAVPCFDTWAVVIPLLFPRIAIALRMFKKEQ